MAVPAGLDRARVSVGLVISECCLRAYDAWSIHLRYRKPPNYVEDNRTLRLALLGESVANGFPYREGGLGYEKVGDFNLLTFTKMLLKAPLGSKNIEIDNYALGGIRAKEVIQRYWTSAKYKPNALVLYCGNNEFACSYKDRAWRPRFLWFIGRLKVGSLLLRVINTKLEKDPRPDPLTQDLLVPSWELEFNRNRYRQSIDIILRHCKEQGIVAIVVIPEANHMLCPNLSTYQGPPGRKREAVRLFKEAFYQKHFGGNESRAKEIMEQLVGFCGFAHLYFELGETYYREGQFDKAHQYLHAAIETDLFPSAITDDYKQILRNLAATYGMPCIDMAEVLAKRLKRPVPDNSCFVDSCHLTQGAYMALSQEIIEVLQAQKVIEIQPAKLDLITANRPEPILPRPVEQYQAMSLQMADALLDCDFIKLYHIQRAITLLKSESFLPPPHPAAVAVKVAELENLLQQERQKLLEWVQRPD